MTNEVSCLKTDIFTVTPHLTEHSLLWHTTAFKDQLTGGGGTDAQLVLLNREEYEKREDKRGKKRRRMEKVKNGQRTQEKKAGSMGE